MMARSTDQCDMISEAITKLMYCFINTEEESSLWAERLHMQYYALPSIMLQVLFYGIVCQYIDT